MVDQTVLDLKWNSTINFPDKTVWKKKYFLCKKKLTIYEQAASYVSFDCVTFWIFILLQFHRWSKSDFYSAKGETHCYQTFWRLQALCVTLMCFLECVLWLPHLESKQPKQYRSECQSSTFLRLFWKPMQKQISLRVLSLCGKCPNIMFCILRFFNSEVSP